MKHDVIKLVWPYLEEHHFRLQVQGIYIVSSSLVSVLLENRVIYIVFTKQNSIVQNKINYIHTFVDRLPW